MNPWRAYIRCSNVFWFDELFLFRKTSRSASQQGFSRKTDAVKKGSEGIAVIDIHEVSSDSCSSHGITSNNCGSKAVANNEIINKNENDPSLEDLSVSYQNVAVSSSTKKAVLSTVEEDANEVDFLALTEQNMDSMISKKRKVKNVVAGSSAAADHYNADESSTEMLKTLDRDRETNLENAISHNSVNKEKDGLNQVGGTMNHMVIAVRIFSSNRFKKKN